MQLNVLEPLFKIFYTFVCKNCFSCRLKFPGKNCRQIYGKSKASIWRNLSTVTAATKICQQNPLLRSFSLQFIYIYIYIFFFFQKSRFTEIVDIRSLYKHCNFSRGCLLFKMASKTVTRSVKNNGLNNLERLKTRHKTLLTFRLITLTETFTFKPVFREKTFSRHNVPLFFFHKL